MKAVMYHYVRQHDPEYPFFRFLDVEDFHRQLEFLGNAEGFVSREDFLSGLSEGRPASGVVLTFDDGFVDHHEHVLPALERHGLWGIFYVPTSPLTRGKVLDVHRVHLLLGRYGGREIARALEDLVRPDLLEPGRMMEFRDATYVGQDNEDAVNYVKRTLNYYLRSGSRTEVLDHLMARYLADETSLCNRLYLSPDGLVELSEAGMTIGSHSVSHPVMSSLDASEQEREIRDSFETLDGLVGGVSPRTFCYPYGGAATFTEGTEALLEEAGCRFSFSVESREITSDDLLLRRQALPRFDCNEFPYGRSWVPT